ncbi:unnamed protein product [Parnassius apollo]|uniref:(apollo) hypothetical protein n=1 Tax=Parnassius apollo TaxID=110799 RepID=A0A8S3X5I7_PARAO|nr:unnamed protein product [Parnassius apollo]
MTQRLWLAEFIELYRNEPCLWQNKSKEYHDRERKSAAYKVLLEKIKESDSTATIDTVKSKINTLRCTFKKEVLKVKSSQRSGSGKDDIYIPKLWYYDLLQFLTDQEVPRSSRSNISKDDEETNDNEDLDSRPGSSLASNHSESDTGNSASSSAPPHHPKPTKRNLNQTLTNDVLLTVQDHFKSPVQRDDRFNIFGKNVAMKLRDLPKEQRILAEGIINEALFLAEMDKLTIDHKISDRATIQQINCNTAESQSILQPYLLDNNTGAVQISIPEMSIPLQENQKIETLITSINEIKQQNVEIRESISFLSAKYDDVLKELEHIKEENSLKTCLINSLEQKIELLEHTVKSKINTLRCTFKKEVLKVKSSQRSGSGKDDIYIPKLWYYDLLQFLTDQEVPRSSRSNISEDDEETNDNEDLDSRPGSSLASNHSESDTGNSASSSAPPHHPRPTKRNLNQTLTNDVLLTVQDHFKRLVSKISDRATIQQINSNTAESQSILQPYLLDNNTGAVQISIPMSIPLQEVNTAASFLSQYMQNES